MDSERRISEIILTPEFDNTLKVVEKLYGIPRTGWVKRNVENPESVGQHVDSLIQLVDEFAEQIKDELDVVKVKRMLQIHDWPEAIVGDIVTAGLRGKALEEKKKEKKEKEERAMNRICSKLGEQGAINLALWYEFEDGITPEATFANQLDKLQAMLKAWEYQKTGEPVFASDFIEHDEARITNPLLKIKLDSLKSEVYSSNT